MGSIKGTIGGAEGSDSGDQGDASAAIAVGSGVLTIDGVEYPGFKGECEISRGYGAEPVGDVSVGERSGNDAIILFSGTTEDGRSIVAEVGCSLYEG